MAWIGKSKDDSPFSREESYKPQEGRKTKLVAACLLQTTTAQGQHFVISCEPKSCLESSLLSSLRPVGALCIHTILAIVKMIT